MITHAAERHAIVIGNSDYIPFALQVTTTDATDMAIQFKSMGYRLFTNGPLLDLNRESIETAIDEFAQSLPSGADAVLYYSGYGLSNDRDSFLLPINNNLKFQSDLRDRTVSLRSIVEILKSYNPNGTNVLLLDANRNNPLSSSFLGVHSGLQKIRDIPEGTFIGYAASTGVWSSDDLNRRNSSYTSQLLEVMATQPGLGIKAMHELVSTHVFKLTNTTQQPVSEDRIFSKWCFVECQTSRLSQVSSQASALNPIDKINVKPTRNYWKIAGGVAIALIAIAAANGGDSGNEPNRIGVSLTPPGQ